MTATTDVEIAAAFRFLFDPPLGRVRYRVGYGGRGSAKSWQFARALLIHGTTRPLRILCGREYQTSIRESVHRLLSDQVTALDLDGFYVVTQSSIRGRNGTEFFFKGLRHNPQEIKSTEGIDVCWVEEAEAVSEASWRILTPTVRKPGSEIWVSFNPALPDDPTYVRFVENPPDDAIVRFVSWRDNPWLDSVLRQEREDLLQRDPEAEAHVWGGEPWTRSDAQVLNGKWAVRDFTPRKHWHGPYFGADWGFAHDPTILVRLFEDDTRLYLDYAIGGIQWDDDETERRFREMPGAEDHVIRADSATPRIISELRNRGLDVRGAEKWKGSVEDGITHLRSYEEIVIHTRAAEPYAKRQAMMWRYKTDDRTDDVLPKLVDGNDDVWDATRYGLEPMIHRTGKRARLLR